MTQRTIPCHWHLIDTSAKECGKRAVANQPNHKHKDILLCEYHIWFAARLSPHQFEQVRYKMRRRTHRVSNIDDYEREIGDLKREIKKLKHDVEFWRDIREPQRKATPVDGFVYIIRPSNGGYIKIGWTSDLNRRMREYAPDTTILGVKPGTRKDENKLHKKFAHLRTHGREWYPLAPQILEEARYMVAKHGEPPVLDFSAREAKTPFMPHKRTGPTSRGWSGVA